MAISKRDVASMAIAAHKICVIKGSKLMAQPVTKTMNAKVVFAHSLKQTTSI